MPVIELLHLQLHPDAPIAPQVLEILSTVRAAVKTNSCFYASVSSPGDLYIIGQWSTLVAHSAFLASPERHRILEPQELISDFKWCTHLDLPDGSQMKDVLPLTAPVIVLERVVIKPEERSADGVMKFIRFVERCRGELDMGCALDGGRVFVGWRCDGKEGEIECAIFSGWESKDAHEEWVARKRVETAEYAVLRKYYLGMDTIYLKDLERQADHK